jgi:alkylhydroperoxidase family enzyme
VHPKCKDIASPVHGRRQGDSTWEIWQASRAGHLGRQPSSVDARAKGETEQRLYLLSAWREAPCYTERERAALGWTDALTRLSEGHALDSARAALDEHFSKEEQVKLTLMINVINGWNRLAVGFGMWVEPAAAKSAARAVA